MKRIIAIVIAMFALASGADAQPYKGTTAGKHHHRLVALVTQAAQPIAAPALDTSCRAPTHDMTAVEFDEVADLVKQYKDLGSQIAKLQAAGPSKVIVARPDKSGLWLDPKSVAYEGSWDEVRDALQIMLKNRLAILDCKLRSHNVRMEPQKNS